MKFMTSKPLVAQASVASCERGDLMQVTAGVVAKHAGTGDLFGVAFTRTDENGYVDVALEGVVLADLSGVAVGDTIYMNAGALTADSDTGNNPAFGKVIALESSTQCQVFFEGLPMRSL